MLFPKNLPRGSISWAFYDWANSAFALTILAGLYGPFFHKYWALDSPEALPWQARCVTIASLIIALFSVIIAPLAKTGIRKRNFLLFFVLLGAVSSTALALLAKGQWVPACILFVFSQIGFLGGNIFYDAMLVDVSTKQTRHFLSSLGYSMGYLGSVLLFICQIAVINNPGILGLTSPESAIKLAFLTSAIWWILFFIPLYLRYPTEKNSEQPNTLNIKKLVGEIIKQPPILYFLLAYWFYIDGVNTIIALATGYGSQLGFSQSTLMQTLILVQIIGVPSTLIFGYLGQKFGAKPLIYIGIAIYASITLYSSKMNTSSVQFAGFTLTQFHLLGIFIGTVQGGLQALSRSFYANLIPPNQESAYFGFYNMVGRSSAILGPIILAEVTHLTGKPQMGSLAIITLFIFAILCLRKAK